MKLKRILSIFFALMLVLSAVPALADIAGATTVSVSLADADSTAGVALVIATITNNSEEAITLTGVECTSKRAITNGTISVTAKTLQPAETYQVLLRASASTSIEGTVTEVFEFTFSVARGTESEPVTETFKVISSVAINFTSLSPSGDDTDTGAAFRLSAYDADKKLVSTPSGDAGKKVTVRLPLLCVQGPVDSVSVTPKLSTSLDEFPFAIEQMDYTYYYNGGTVSTNQVIEMDYAFRLAKQVTAGVKKVDFLVSYKSGWGDGSTQTTTVSVYVNVVNGYTEETASTTPVVSQPKLILESYSLSSDKIYAGEEFAVNFTLKNTSSSEAVQNIQISIADTDDTGKLLPAENGSNTIYIAKIDKGESYEVNYRMQSSPDIDPKAYKLGVTMAYEGAKNVVAYTASDTISVTILQKVRLKFDTPVFYDECYVGSTCGAYLAMYNMGRSSVYNCMIGVEGDGLEMEETYFGGTVTAGSTMSADFNIITNTAGQIDGFIVVTYEDSLGEQMEEKIPISLYVTDMNDMGDKGDGTIDYGDADSGYIDSGVGVDTGMSNGVLPLWAWIVIGAAAVACVVAVLLVLKKKRNKQLEDI